MDPSVADAYWKPAPGETALLRVLPPPCGLQPHRLNRYHFTGGKSLVPLPVKLRPRIANVSAETIAALTRA